MSRIKLCTGTLPSPQLERLGTSHPFVQQIDLVLPSRIAQDHTFSSLKTTYSTAQFTLSELYEYASRFPIPDVPFKAVPVQCDATDTWCIDPWGVLTLCISKDLYEQLGLVGTTIPFKGCPEQYVIRISLKRETASAAVQARQTAALGIWDRKREVQGLGRWRVAYVGPPISAPTSGSMANPDAYAVMDVTTCVRRDTDVYVPHIGDLVQSTTESPEDHQDHLEALFEWVGMACLGAQRLHANDRVDPYVAVYEAPSLASIDDVMYVRWDGLMDDTFVRSVIDTAVSTVSTAPSSGDNNPFISITLHSNLRTPVSYLPDSPTKEAPPRVPGPGAEDTICLVLSKSSDKFTWATAQSIGKWDARWG